MVKKTRTQPGGVTSSLGFVCNDDLLDDILGEETNYKKSQPKKKPKLAKFDTE